MFERIYKETVMISSKLLDKKRKALFIVLVILISSYLFFLSHFEKYYPGVHLDAEYPKLFNVFVIICFLFGVSLLTLIIFGIHKIY